MKWRYRYIRYLLDINGKTVRDLHREYSKVRKVHYTIFYRVCRGQKKSHSIQEWIARQLKIQPQELWHDE